MSNQNNNNRQQPQAAPNKPTDPVTVVASVPVKSEESVLRDAVLMCLKLLLRTASYGSLPRSHEAELNLMISKVEQA